MIVIRTRLIRSLIDAVSVCSLQTPGAIRVELDFADFSGKGLRATRGEDIRPIGIVRNKAVIAAISIAHGGLPDAGVGRRTYDTRLLWLPDLLVEVIHLLLSLLLLLVVMIREGAIVSAGIHLNSAVVGLLVIRGIARIIRLYLPTIILGFFAGANFYLRRRHNYRDRDRSRLRLWVGLLRLPDANAGNRKYGNAYDGNPKRCAAAPA